MNLKKAALVLGTGALCASFALAQEDERKIPHLDHVFVIMMENHHISQILGNPNAPFATQYAASANLAKNYYAVGHPSLTNYLEVIGGSNFGIVNDDSPDWHNGSCTSTLSVPVDETAATNSCPISGTGMDAATPALDTTNEGTPAEPIHNFPLDPAPTVGMSIGDQLVRAGLSWKSYQEDLPPYGADGVNNSDGLLSNLHPSPSNSVVPNLYAVKHNPFVYFASVQSGDDPENSLKNVTGFDALYSDLASGHVPNLAFIAPNQCHDQHGRGTSEVGPGCSDDQSDIAQGDAALKTLISGIKGSAMWKEGHNVIVTLWDENDYSSLPNQVATIVDTNYGRGGHPSARRYNHFSLLKTMEAGFGLDYLNHAADKDVKLMTDLFSK